MTDPFLPTGGAPTATGSAMDRRVARSRLAKLRRWRLPATAVLLAGAGLLAIRLIPASGTLSVNAADLTLGNAQPAPFQDYLPVRATLAPLQSVFVDAVQGGQVASVAVQDGAALPRGAILATLANPQLQLDVAARAASITGDLGHASSELLSLQQGLATERDAIAQTSYDLLKANRDLSVRQELHAQGFESDASVKNFSDDAKYYATRLAMLRGAYAHDADLAARQSQQIDATESLLRGNLASVQASLDALTIRAPVGGRLTDFDLQPGQTIKQGDRIGQIDSTGAFRLDADIDEFYLGRISPGQIATADFDATPVTLHVSRVHPQVSGGQFRAEFIFTAALPPDLRRGETADLRITLGQTHTALVVPNGPWLNATGGNSIFVIDAAGRHAERRPITAGRRNPDQVEITAGLRPGERVITSAYANFQNFSHLSVQQDAP